MNLSAEFFTIPYFAEKNGRNPETANELATFIQENFNDFIEETFPDYEFEFEGTEFELLHRSDMDEEAGHHAFNALYEAFNPTGFDTLLDYDSLVHKLLDADWEEYTRKYVVNFYNEFYLCYA